MTLEAGLQNTESITLLYTVAKSHALMRAGPQHYSMYVIIHPYSILCCLQRERNRTEKSGTAVVATSETSRTTAHAHGVHACAMTYHARTSTALALAVRSMRVYDFIFSADR